MKFIVCYFKPIPLLEIDSQFIQKHILSHSWSLGIHLVYSSFGFKTLHWCFVKSWSNFHDQFIRTFFQMENGLFFLYHRGKPMLATKEVQKFVKEPVLASFDAAVDIKPGLKSDSIFLRVLPELGKPLFATQLTDDINVAEVEYRFGGKFVDMRVAIFNVDENPWSKFLCKGHALLRWHQRLRFCSSCGHEMGRNFAGNQRECLSCKTMQYPTTFPVAIVLLTTPDHSKVRFIIGHSIPGKPFNTLCPQTIVFVSNECSFISLQMNYFCYVLTNSLSHIHKQNIFVTMMEWSLNKVWCDFRPYNALWFPICQRLGDVVINSLIKQFLTKMLRFCFYFFLF